MIEWKRITPLVGPIYYYGYVGEIKCFIISWNIREGKNYKIVSSLPEIEETTINTVEEGKFFCDTFLNDWLKKTGLKIDESK